MSSAQNVLVHRGAEATANRSGAAHILQPAAPKLPRKAPGPQIDTLATLEALLEPLRPNNASLPGSAVLKLAHGRTASSLDALVSDLRCFSRFRSDQKQLRAGSTSESVAQYLQHLKRLRRSPATILRHAASLNRAYVSVGAPSPLADTQLKQWLAKQRTGLGSSRPVTLPVRRGDSQALWSPTLTVEAMLLACADDLLGYRNAALLSLAYELGLGASGLVNIATDDMILQPNGTGTLAAARKSPVPITAATTERISRWITAGGITAGPLFRRLVVQQRSALAARGDAQLGPGQTLYLVDSAKLTRQGLNVIWRRLAYRAADLGLVDLHGPSLKAALAALSTRSLRQGRAADVASSSTACA